MLSFRQSWHSILDAAFPRVCVLCACPGTLCCPACWQSLALPQPFACLGCQRDVVDGRTCARCHASYRTVAGAWTVGRYAEPDVRRCIQAYKFAGLTDLVDPLTALLSVQLDRPPVREILTRRNSRWIIVPVPADPRRRRTRGLHATGRLATRLGTLTAIPVHDLLARDHRRPQSALAPDARQRNLRGAIRLRQPLALVGASVILLDDVVTTGATVRACADVLVAAGARAVWALALARG